MAIGQVPLSTAVQVGEPSGIDDDVRDEAGHGVDESLTSSAAIMRDIRHHESGMQRSLSKGQTFKSPTYVPDEDIKRPGDARQGERLAAEYTIHIDSWCDTNLAYLVTKAEECLAAADRHTAAQRLFIGKHKTLVIPNIVFSAVAASTAAIASASGNNVASGATVVLSTLAAVLGGINNLHEWGERSQRHGMSAVRFKELASHIIGLTHLQEELRRPYEVELTYVGMSLGGILAEEPLLPPVGATHTWLQKICFIV
jgi:hypothetical protein